MNIEKTWYMAQRAEALAVIYLTRREDLRVRGQAGNDGSDLLVEILHNGHSDRRVFAVQVKARMDIVQDTSQLQIAHKDWAGISFPVCLFFFAMRNDEAFYTWITEPIITANGHPKLHFNIDAPLNRLDNTALDSIVSQVDQWYDALVKELAA